MESYELKPTEENIRNTFLNDDISRDIEVIRFCQLIDSAPNGYAIALDGKWGSGKTFFVKQSKMVLDSYNSSLNYNDAKKIKDKCLRIDEKFVPDSNLCIYYDAWSNDNDDDPILSLVYTIAQDINVEFPSMRSDNYLEKAASILELVSGRNWEKIIDSFRSSNQFSEIQESKDLESNIKDFLNSILVERGNKLVIFIDELDRCKPSYAVRVLERIKHYFTNSSIVFVFALNSFELQNTIKRYYGDEFNACRYLDRFFDFQISLSKINLQKYYNLIGFNNFEHTYNIVCDSVIKTFQMEMREIGRFINLSKITFETINKKIKNDVIGWGTQFCIIYFAPVIIGLKITDKNRYSDFIEGKDPQPLLNVIVSSNLKSYVFTEILEQDETLDDDDTNKQKVTIEDKFKEIYRIVFSSTYKNQGVKIGEITFSVEMKEIILQTIDTLSKYTDFQ